MVLVLSLHRHREFYEEACFIASASQNMESLLRTGCPESNALKSHIFFRPTGGPVPFLEFWPFRNCHCVIRKQCPATHQHTTQPHLSATVNYIVFLTLHSNTTL